MATFYSIVLGLFAVLMIGLALFIHYLRIGLNSHDAVVIDSKPKSNE